SRLPPPPPSAPNLPNLQLYAGPPPLHLHARAASICWCTEAIRRPDLHAYSTPICWHAESVRRQDLQVRAVLIHTPTGAIPYPAAARLERPRRPRFWSGSSPRSSSAAAPPRSLQAALSTSSQAGPSSWARAASSPSTGASSATYSRRDSSRRLSPSSSWSPTTRRAAVALGPRRRAGYQRDFSGLVCDGSKVDSDSFGSEDLDDN
ncbi:unnamed protein product, partial [Urochloa humidicola]